MCNPKNVEREQEKAKKRRYLTEAEEAAEREREQQKEKEESKSTFNSADIIKQLYVRNCALCILSRFALTDDVFEADKCETNSQFLEAFHVAVSSNYQ